jgi:excisionase family DNA binding protein
MPTPKRANDCTEQARAESAAALTIPAAATYLSVSPRTVYDLMRAGQIGAFRIGPRKGAVRISRAELDRYISEAQAWEPAS